MITIHELLEDPKFKDYFCAVPKLPDHLKGGGRKPFRLYVQLKSNHQWKQKNFATYVEAFKYFKRARDLISDAAIGCPGYPFDPPKRIVRVKGKYFTKPDGSKVQVTKELPWKPTLPAGEEEQHHWCPYCRRPTVFKMYKRHHALTARKLGGVGVDPSLLRCAICGASENIVNLRKY